MVGIDHPESAVEDSKYGNQNVGRGIINRPFLSAANES